MKQRFLEYNLLILLNVRLKKREKKQVIKDYDEHIFI